MPAISQAQQRYFGMLHGNPAMERARGVSDRVAKEFASTKRKGLPQHVVHAAKRKAAEAFGRGR